MRTCVACRTSGDKRGLLRIVRGADGVARFDPSGKTAGRGAYVCASNVCIETARKRKSLERSLSTSVPSPVYDDLLSAAIDSLD